MQVEQVPPSSPAKSLEQGCIFKLDGLKFLHDGKEYSLNQFYPSVSLEGITHGIVMSQSCDMERGPGRTPIPYITIGLLEPFHRHIRREEDWSQVAMPFPLRDESGNDVWHTAICSEKLEGVLGRHIKSLLQNNAKIHFFVAFDEKDVDSRYFVANLTKAFPIRLRHYNEILTNVTHRLKYEFARKLSWKIANLYGRADTEDYDKDAASTVTEHLMELMDKALRVSRPLEFSKTEFKQAEALRDSTSDQKTAFLNNLMKERRAKDTQKAKQQDQKREKPKSA